MPTGFAIEPMRELDVPEVVEIEKACFTTPWPASAYKRELKQVNTTRYIIARHYLSEPVPGAPPPKKSFFKNILPFLNNETEEAALSPNPNPVVGYAGLWMMLDEAHITTIGVDPKYRGKGLGELLLIGMIDIALELGSSFLTLEVRVSNTVAQNLYKKYSFKISGTRKKYYTDNDEDAYIMWSDEITKIGFREKYKELKGTMLRKLAENGELAAPEGAVASTDATQSLIMLEVHDGPLIHPPKES